MGPTITIVIVAVIFIVLFILFGDSSNSNSSFKLPEKEKTTLEKKDNNILENKVPQKEIIKQTPSVEKKNIPEEPVKRVCIGNCSTCNRDHCIED